MKSLEERRAQRKSDREELAERQNFNHAEYLRENPKYGNSSGGGDHGGADTRKDRQSQGEGGAGGGNGGKADDTGGQGEAKPKEAGETGKSTGTNTPAAAPGSVPEGGDAEKIAREKAAREQGVGWGSTGAGNNAGATGGPTAADPQHAGTAKTGKDAKKS